MSASPKTQEDELPEIHSPNARLGMILFVVYLAGYVGFMALAVFSLDTLAAPSPIGVNWGLLYGLALIIGAFVLALLYMFLCNTLEPGATNSASAAGSKEGGR